MDNNDPKSKPQAFVPSKRRVIFVVLLTLIAFMFVVLLVVIPSVVVSLIVSFRLLSIQAGYFLFPLPISSFERLVWFSIVAFLAYIAVFGKTTQFMYHVRKYRGQITTSKGNILDVKHFEVNRAKLRDKIRLCFNISELRDLCFELDEDHEAILLEDHSQNPRRIVEYFDRRNRIDELVEACLRARPRVSWDDLYDDQDIK